MKKTDIDKLSYAELNELNKQTEDRLKALKNNAKKELRRKLVEMCKAEGFSLYDVVGDIKKPKKDGKNEESVKRVAKKQYKDPKTGKIYKGFGPKPSWLKDKNGKVIEKYLITD
jgi:DNA-binding protein H-NS